MEALHEATLDLAWGSNSAFDPRIFIPRAVINTSLHVCQECLYDHARNCISYPQLHFLHLRMKTRSCLSVVGASKMYVVCGVILATS